VTPLGGLWAARSRREELVRLAAEAMHCLRREVDYAVVQGWVRLPEPPPDRDEAQVSRGAVLQALLEVKEGCRSSARREVVARCSVPAFLARYTHLAGACADARGLERELWSLYGLKAARAGPLPRRVRFEFRVFATGEAAQAALLGAARAASAAGATAVLAVRGATDAAALEAALAQGGVAAVVSSPSEPAAATGEARLLVGELLEARRHVERVAAACGARSAAIFLSLDDERTAGALPRGFAGLARWLTGASQEVPSPLATLLGRLACRNAERSQASLRQELASREQYLRDTLAFAGEGD
ncbi:MAG TPA: hypothetical protein VM489_02280, partial [Burkholderiales bacterium]|nr:hypothetical protein [Burkholderiales bacterium]